MVSFFFFLPTVLSCGSFFQAGTPGNASLMQFSKRLFTSNWISSKLPPALSAQMLCMPVSSVCLHSCLKNPYFQASCQLKKELISAIHRTTQYNSERAPGSHIFMPFLFTGMRILVLQFLNHRSNIHSDD